jgi:hypothetical protein
VLRVGGTEADGCAACRGLAERVRIPRSEARPFAGWIPAAFAYPLHPGGILSILGLALVMQGLRIFGFVGGFLALGLYWSFLFGVIVRTWHGQAALEPPDFTSVLDDLVAPALRGLLATAILWVPAAFRIASIFGDTEPGSADPTALISAIVADPLLWLLLVVGVVFFPAAMIAAAVSRSFLSPVNPLVPIQMARILGMDYAIAVGTTFGLGIVGTLVDVAARATVGRLPVVGGTLAVALGAYLPIVSARILGLLLHVRGDALDLGQTSDYLDPVLPDRAPAGGLLELEPAPRAPRAEELRAEGPGPVARAVPIHDDPPGEAAPPRETPLTPLEEISAAIGVGDRARAYAAYRRQAGQVEGLGAGALFEIARGASEAKDHAVAAWALSCAAAFPDDPVVPDALLVLGRIYRARLGKPAEGRQALEALIARYPGSAAAAAARKELGDGA